MPYITCTPYFMPCSLYQFHYIDSLNYGPLQVNPLSYLEKFYRSFLTQVLQKPYLYACHMLQLSAHTIDDDLCIFSLSVLVALTRTRFPKFNCNMMVGEHPTRIVGSIILWYGVIFRADFFDKFGF